MRREATIATLGVAVILLITGCAETPRQPVMRPIPPPPPGPPPGVATVIYAPPPTSVAAAPVSNLSTNTTTLSNYEVSSNFVASVQSTNALSGQAQVSPSGTPQYELIPPRPGPNYLWRDGFWRWEGTTWAWVPGQWEPHPQAVIFVEPSFGFGYDYYHYGGAWRHGPGRHRRWR